MIKNLSYSLIGVLSQVIGVAVFFFIIARALGPEKLGEFSVYYAVSGLLKIAVDYGYPQQFLKDFNCDNQKYGGIRYRVIHLKIIISILVVFTTFLCWGIYGFDLSLFGVILSYSIILSFAQLFSCAMQGLSQYKEDSINYFSSTVAGCIMALMLLYIQCDQSMAYAMIMLAQSTIYLLLSLKNFRASSAFVSESINKKNLLEEIKKGTVYAADVFAMRSFMYLDVIILNFFVSSTEVGIYQAGQKLVQGVMPLSQAINNVVLPRLSRGKIQSQSYKYLLAVMTLVGLLGFLGFFFMGDLVISVIYGDRYKGISHYLLYYGFIVFLRYSSFASSVMLTASGNQKIRLYVNIMSTFLLFFLGSILSYFWSVEGMLCALVVVSSFTWIIYFFGARHKIF